MKLLNKFESCYYEAITKMFCQPSMSYEEAKKFIEDNIDVKIDFEVLDSLLSKKDKLIFLYDIDKKLFSPIVKKDVPVILNNIEIDALKNLVHMDIAEGFLKQSTLDKIKEVLKEREAEWSVYNIKYKRQYSDGDKNNMESINSKIEIILYAIRKKCAIKCDNYTRNNNLYKDQIIFPLKIEYSLINDKYRLYCFKKEPDENKYIKMNISRIQNLEILEDKTREKDENFIKLNEKNTKTVKLYVDPEKHVLERCFRLFSYYNREAVYDRENNRYILIIDYDVFDESDVIKNILSLGSRVVVESPHEIREVILSRVKKAISNYEKLCD